MIITCEACNSSFKLDESLLKPTGSKVRCSKCNEIFTAYPPEPPEDIEAPDETASDVEEQPVAEDIEADEKEMADPDVLDFSDVDTLMDDKETSEDIADEDIEDLELELDPDIESETEQATEASEVQGDLEQPDELDLSDLENLLEEEEEREDAADEAIEDMDMKIEPETDASMEKMPPDAESEELDELDLSDLEEMLDLDESTPEVESEPEDIELELDMDTEPELEKAAETGDAEDVDLSEIEKMLEVEEEKEDETETEKEPVDQGVDLELDMEEETEATELAEDSSQVEVYELDEIGDVADEADAMEAAETTDQPEATEAAAIEEAEPEFEVGISEQEDELEEEVVEEEPATVPKRSVSKPLVVLLILTLLGGGAYGAYVLLDFMNIEIPFISDYFKPKVSDPTGSLEIDTFDVNSKFMLNVKEGKLFVITGRIKNGYPDVRSFIKINGKLYTKGKNLFQTETVFCGNVLSDIELSNMELEAMKKRLSNRFGDNKSNTQIQPGGEVPFMLIFSNLPEDLEEFSIEVVSSSPAGAAG